jgi:hypothetical protein
MPWSAKIEAVFHLTSNFTYPLLLLLALLLLPVMLGPSAAPPALVWAVQAGVVLFGIVPVSVFLAAGQHAAGQRGPRVAGHVLAALVIGIGLSVNNARAVLEGLGRGRGEWERTPKSGDRSVAPGLAPYRVRAARAGHVELALAVYFTCIAAFAMRAGEWHALPFVLLLVGSFGIVGAASLRSAWRPPVLHARARREAAAVPRSG